VRILAAGAVVVVALLAMPLRADAHASLESTTPASGEQLKTAPSQVVLRFSETVSISGDSIRVLNTKGQSVTGNKAKHANGQGSVVALQLPKLADGAYVVSWKAISSDSHPVNGAFTFRIGAAAPGSNDQAALANVLKGSTGGGDHVLGAIFAVTRFVGFAGLVLVVGGMIFLTWVWPAGQEDRKARRIFGGGLIAAAAAAALSIPIQGAYGVEGTLGDVFSPSKITDELGTRTGRAWMVRLVLLGAVWLLARARKLDRWSAAALGFALIVTVSLTGHASSGNHVPLAFVVDMVHLSGATIWLGGLVMLAGAVLWPRSGDPTDVEPTVNLFSQVAFAAVAVIVVSGVIQALRQVGSYDNLFQTTYGKLLVIKVLIFGGMLVGAAFSRAWIRERAAVRASGLQLSPGPGAVAASVDRDPTALSLLRWSVGAEVVLGVCVLAVTALLVNAVPGNAAGGAAAGGPFHAEIHGEAVLVTADIKPTVVGPANFSLKVTDHGLNPLNPPEVTATMQLQGGSIGAIPLKLTKVGEGQYTANNTEIPLAGAWNLHILVRTDNFNEESLLTTVPFS